jgi:predicted MFS family arabinose efflux permease
VNTSHATLHINDDQQREQLLRLLAALSFLIFFQAYMVAPIIPALAAAFHAPIHTVALIVPAYLIPYGVGTVLYGVLSDRLGAYRVMLASLTAFSAFAFATATSTSVEQILVWRVITGFGASGAVPLAIALVGRLYPYEQRGRPLGWLFGAMAAGMALGSPLGAILIPFIGGPGLFVMVGASGMLLLLLLQKHREYLAATSQPGRTSLAGVLAGYRELLGSRRGSRTYAYVFVNSMFHSGVFTWLSVFIEERYHLGTAGIGVALLGYGIPGALLGPLIGRAADRCGRATLLPVGLGLGAAAVALLLLGPPLALVPIIAVVLSLGYDMTQPLFAGIVTSLGGKRPGQAMGLNVFSLFIGAGVGSLVFGSLVRHGFLFAFGAFSAMELVIAVMAIRAFRSERPATHALRATIDR